MRERIDGSRVHEFAAAARAALTGAKDELRAAEEAHALADPAFIDALGLAESYLDASKVADQRTRDEVAWLERLESEAAAIPVSMSWTEIREQLESGESISTALAEAEASVFGARMEAAAAAQRRRAVRAAGIGGGCVLILGLLVAAVR